MKLTTRFSAQSLMAATLLAAVAAAGLVFTAQLRDRVLDLQQNALTPTRLLAKLDAALLGTRLQALAGQLHDPGNPVSALHDHPIQMHVSAVERLRDDLSQTAAALRALPAEPASAQRHAAIADGVGAYVNTVVQPSIQGLSGGQWEAVARQITLSNGRYSALKGAIDQASGAAAQAEAQAIAQAEALSRQAQAWVAGLALLCLAGLGASAWRNVQAVRRSTRVAGTIARQLSQLDLRPVDTRGLRDEIGALCQALNGATAALAQTFRVVQQGANNVAEHAGEVASGSQDLSARTEAQAASLEQTASATEQLAATVQNNDQSARQARAVADTATALAAESGRTMDQAVATMRRVGESSQRISEIISVIDGIAFQTNILALNAAVEAARAGEQGRGFAVVAAEVRALAQRSASAAREITGLIDASVSAVRDGGTQVEQTSQTLARLVEQVGSVSTILERITVASAEQANGIREMSLAVHQLDSSTQQNAGLVQHSAAAAATLKAEAARVQQALAVFTASPG